MPRLLEGSPRRLRIAERDVGDLVLRDPDEPGPVVDDLAAVDAAAGLLAGALVDEAHPGDVDPSGPLGDEQSGDRLLVVADDRRAPNRVGLALAPIGGEAQEDA